MVPAAEQNRGGPRDAADTKAPAQAVAPADETRRRAIRRQSRHRGGRGQHVQDEGPRAPAARSAADRTRRPTRGGARPRRDARPATTAEGAGSSLNRQSDRPRQRMSGQLAEPGFAGSPPHVPPVRDRCCSHGRPSFPPPPRRPARCRRTRLEPQRTRPAARTGARQSDRPSGRPARRPPAPDVAHWTPDRAAHPSARERPSSSRRRRQDRRREPIGWLAQPGRLLGTGCAPAASAGVSTDLAAACFWASRTRSA